MYNPRGVLGVSATASPEEVRPFTAVCALFRNACTDQIDFINSSVCPVQIKQAFRQKSLQCHPDLCPPAQRQSAEAAFREVAEAYSILSKGKAVFILSVSPHTSCAVLPDPQSLLFLMPWAVGKPSPHQENQGLQSRTLACSLVAAGTLQVSQTLMHWSPRPDHAGDALVRLHA